MIRVEVHHGAASDVGLVREVNEDAFLVAPPVFVVADGMGGHDRGDIASRIVVEEFGRLAPTDRASPRTSYDADTGIEAVSGALQASEERIAAYDAAQLATGATSFSAGTTAVAALLVERDGSPGWLLANVGDSRAYRFSDGALEQVSVDHSVVQELIDAGRISVGDAAQHPERHVVTRALGGSAVSSPDWFLLPLVSAERLLLCSDGVSGMIDDATIATILARSEDPRDAADLVVATAVEAGGPDNATAVVVDVVGWGHDMPYDSDAGRLSLEQKLGALP